MKIDLSPIDLEDYATIKRYVPEATPKQVKWIKELMEWERQLVGVNTLLPTVNDFAHPFKINCLRGYKSVLRKMMKKRTKPTDYEASGQLELFHPEAFQGGDNQTLQEM